ncbi:MAG: HD-GYP domain-containing protein [Lachnospiraceae bacterium]
MTNTIYLDIIAILETTLNYVDRRLIDHGKRVSYLVYKTLKLQGGLSDEQVRDICLLATIHDIGAYKTEEIDKMLQFETEDVWEHSIYGYLFVNYLSPISYLAPALLFHHADLRVLKHLHPSYRNLAQLIFVADRIDIVHQSGADGKAAIFSQIEAHAGTLFDPAIIQWVSDIDVDWTAQDFGSSQDAAYQEVHQGFNSSYTREEQYELLKMIIYSMEFRSPQTVSHTVTSTQAGVSIAQLAGLPPDQQEVVRLGSMIHDIGKVGIPIAILESPNRFTETEYQIMKNHVSISVEILEGKVDRNVISLAARHHERMNGSGYPNGIAGDDLTIEERIIAVADVVSALCGTRTYKDSYPKTKVVHILEDSRDRNQLDGDLVDLCIAHYEEIVQGMKKASLPLLEAYRQIQSGYVYLKATTAMVSQPGNGLGFLLDQKLTAFEL